MEHDATAGEELDRGRRAADEWRCAEAYELLARAAGRGRLAAEDLERLGLAAHLTGHDQEATSTLEQAHEAFLAAGEVPRAVRVAFWLALGLLERGESVRGGGWLARARRLLDGYGHDCVERGYLCLPVALQRLATGDAEGARASSEEAIAAGERFADLDLTTLGRLGAGQALVLQGAPEAGTALLDEAMVSVTVGAVTPLVAGIVYCAVIETCHATFDVRRAQEWTAALSAWCDAHPDVLAYRGQCLTYRSEIMRLHGAWQGAMEEAQRAEALLSRPPAHPAVGSTLYERAELHRLRGEFEAAEEAYRAANRWGRHPEPGLALLRLARGRTTAAAAAIRRALDEARDGSTRSRLLPAFVEVMLAAGDAESARGGARELRGLADRFNVELLRAAAARAEGETLLAGGDAHGALAALRRASAAWQTLAAPYEAARVRVLIARACALLGDGESAELERDAARSAFLELGALADLAALDRATEDRRSGSDDRDAGDLTPRELDVLRLVATGKSNRDIAAELVISEKTVARHVSNILAKVDVASRTAAAAYAHRQGLL